jgi:hypothetical protein
MYCLFCVVLCIVCVYTVLYYCHRVVNQLQLNISYLINTAQLLGVNRVFYVQDKIVRSNILVLGSCDSAS